MLDQGYSSKAFLATTTGKNKFVVKLFLASGCCKKYLAVANKAPVTIKTPYLESSTEVEAANYSEAHQPLKQAQSRIAECSISS